MLVRTYRLTDKFGVLVLKSSAAFGSTTLDGVSLVVGAARWGSGRTFGVIFGFLFAVLQFIYGLLKAVGRFIWRILRVVLGVIGAVVLFVFGRIAPQTRRAGRATTGAATGVMARRAARAELQATVTEDPLRVQNRVLSGLVVVVLVALIGVVLWATNPARSSAPTLLDTNFNLAGNATPIATTAGEGIVFSTPVPTATDVPDVVGVGGSLAYVVRERGQTDIWATDVINQRPLRLTNSPEDDRDPAWSPNGRRLAYASRRDGNWDIYVYDLDSNATTRMTFGLEFEAGPQWSPDGSYLVYETYRNNNLDIYFVAVDGSQAPLPLPANSTAPDFSPAWSPEADNGRHIAFTSWRDGNQDIYVFSLDNEELINLTNTPTRHEDYPVWSPDGRWVAYSAVDGGVEKVFAKRVDDPSAPAVVVALGRTPAWSPDGVSLVAAVDSVESTQLVASAAPGQEARIAVGVVPVPLGATRPTWTGTPLPAALVNSGGLPLEVTEDLYVEQEDRHEDEPRYRMGLLVSVDADYAYLSDRVNDSFNALRRAVLERSGTDFLGKLGDTIWDINRPPEPGEDPRTWFKTGRAFGFLRDSIRGFPPPIEIVREDVGLNTWWRVYVRVADEAQTGQLGEPLRRMPWDFLSRTTSDVTAYEQGGRLRTEMPTGYYVDLTQLALDYDWSRLSAGNDWRANNNSINYWVFLQTDGLDWYSAMLEQFPEGQLLNFAPTPTVAPSSGG
jgi:hypothetical protein